MGTLDYIKAAIELARKAQQVKLAEQLMSVREEMLELKEENLKLREENGALKDGLKLKGEMQHEGGAYFVKVGQKKEPFCPRCWEVGAKQVRLLRVTNHHPKCPQCKTWVEEL